MKLVQITSPDGAVSLLNVDQIKSIVPFGDGQGCTIQIMGDPECQTYKSAVNFRSFMEHMNSFDVDVCYPTSEPPAPKLAVEVKIDEKYEDDNHKNQLTIENLTNELEAERSRSFGFRVVLCTVLTSISRNSLDPKRFISIITKAIEDVPASGPASSRRAVLELGQQMVLRSTSK